MIINKQKRIGNVIIFAEGENPEYELIEKIFHCFLGYSITTIKRSDKIITELHGYDKFSKITLLNAPTSNIKSLYDEKGFFDFIFKEYAVALDIDTKNSPVYFVFDRDPVNNKQGIVEKLLNKLTSSQNDSEEQNGLLILSYPSIESFTLSLNEKNSCSKKFRLGKDLKNFILTQKYKTEVNGATLINAINDFANFLLDKSIIDKPSELPYKLDVIGTKIFEIQKNLYSKERLFYCLSQLVEILIDLQIIEF